MSTMEQSYTVIIERDSESGWLVAEVVELPGCYTQAPDLPTLEANIQEAIAVYLESDSPPDNQPEFVGTWRVRIPA